MEISRQTYEVDAFTATRKIKGLYQPIGNPLIDINSVERRCVVLSEATFVSLSSHSTLRQMSVPQVIVNKNDLLFISFQDGSVIGQLNLLKRTVRVIAYTAAFVLRGDFHLGAEQRVHDMFDTMKGDFQAMTDVTFFPLVETQVSLPRQSMLVLIDTTAIQLYHPEIAS